MTGSCRERSAYRFSRWMSTAGLRYGRVAIENVQRSGCEGSHDGMAPAFGIDNTESKFRLRRGHTIRRHAGGSAWDDWRETR